jgi:recombination protein RecR
MNGADSLESLKTLLAKLPGVGRRSAARMAVHAASRRDGYLRQLITVLEQVEREMVACSQCGAMTTVDRTPCRLCIDPRRDDRMVCVVEDPEDIEIMERAGVYRGRYFALGGKLAPTRGDQAVLARVQQLTARIRAGGVDEVLLALNSDVESDATAHYIAEQLGGLAVRVSRLARGIPAGSGLAYADPVTLEAAVRHRTAY